MKYLTVAFIALALCGCANFHSDPWAWMDDPALQSWDQVTIQGHGREISFSIPNAVDGGGSWVIRGPAIEPGERSQEIIVPFEALDEAWYQIVEFNWERSQTLPGSRRQVRPVRHTPGISTMTHIPTIAKSMGSPVGQCTCRTSVQTTLPREMNFRSSRCAAVHFSPTVSLPCRSSKGKSKSTICPAATTTCC